ncbi:hypothetical protein RGR602_PC01585 (plasmid) [Rhizobium gallicum bv. gallicum R602sp]|uniref:Uncharacterized protein n=1 Tax=Rhizobium gallicum bv. gallicum R602sp TaxID=1041138 RepID=A0A0B4XET6_9HYPH|nr:hypothetical protein [Rhizobium gallicum]AJD45611.1 hypothetical protein RGR602_PC01585 [Rhizobium gallicum bv. gallicum R602sp]
MRLLTISILSGAIFATPCLYDFASQEPSPLDGLRTAASALAVEAPGSRAKNRLPRQRCASGYASEPRRVEVAAGGLIATAQAGHSQGAAGGRISSFASSR